MIVKNENKGLRTNDKGQILLAIDIGNSATKFGVFDGENFVNYFSIPTKRDQSANEIYRLIQHKINGRVSFVIISSVVSELDNSYRELAENLFEAAVKFVDNKFDSRLKIKYFPPETLGTDRLIAAFAAVEKYGQPVIICDFGTATTIDAVNSAGEFLGGIITPGINVLADALFQRTSKLPKVELKKPESIFGNSTTKSIQSGIYNGYTGLVNGILQQMTDALGEKPKIVATGGFARLIAESAESIEIVDETLMLDGLRMIFQQDINSF